MEPFTQPVMEIKIECECGTRFKFDVEPIHGRMPAPIRCPACDGDRTEQANSFIQAQAAPSQEIAALMSPAVAATPSSPSTLPPAMATGGTLRINRPLAPPPIGATASGHVPPPISMPPAFGASRKSPTPPRASHKLKGALATAGTVLVIALGVIGFGSKWFRRIRTLAKIATEVAVAGESSEPAEVNLPKNLVYDNCVSLFIQHSNHLEVAEACKQYWKEQLHKNLSLMAASEEAFKQGTSYQLYPAHNGYVRIISGLEWPETQFEGLCRFLSQRFNSLVFEAMDVDFSGAHHFGVYEAGARKFHSQMDVRIVGGDEKDSIKNEGEDWVVARGYQPAAGGFKKFNLFEGDRVTQAMGMKLWDESADSGENFLLLKE
jgi:hypothetical protein